MPPFSTPSGTSDVQMQVNGGTVDSNHREGWRTYPAPLFEVGAAYGKAQLSRGMQSCLLTALLLTFKCCILSVGCRLMWSPIFGND